MGYNDIPVTPEEDEAWSEHLRTNTTRAATPDGARATIDRVVEMAVCRRGSVDGAVESYLPRWLRWVAQRPRILRVLYRFRPGWEPEVTAGVDLGVVVIAVRHKAGYYIVETL